MPMRAVALMDVHDGGGTLSTQAQIECRCPELKLPLPAVRRSRRITHEEASPWPADARLQGHGNKVGNHNLHTTPRTTG